MKLATIESYQERVLRVVLHIQNHLDDELELDDLARVACFSPFHFHRVFRGLVGEPVQEHVRRLRLERAALRLKLGDVPVTEAAFDAGFESHEGFTRAFHERFGAPPSQFRGTVPPGPPPAVELQSLPTARVVFLRHTGPYDRVSATWSKLAMWAGMRGLFGPAARFIGISYDDPDITPAEKLRYDAAITVKSEVKPEGEFGVTELAGGDYATVTHRGPYEGLGRVYPAVFGSWLPNSGRELRDVPCFELYLNSPQTARPEDLLTVIHIPVD
jgi:AraC family transcriptional regulator